MGRTVRNAVNPRWPETWDTFGPMVSVRHVAAAPMGAAVTFRAEVLEQSGKRLLFGVVDEDAPGTIGDGTEERAVIEIARFAAGWTKRAAG